VTIVSLFVVFANNC